MVKTIEGDEYGFKVYKIRPREVYKVFIDKAETNINKIIIYVLIFILTLSIIGFYFYNRKINKLIKHIHKWVGIKDFIRRGRK